MTGACCHCFSVDLRPPACTADILTLSHLSPALLLFYLGISFPLLLRPHPIPCTPCASFPFTDRSVQDSLKMTVLTLLVVDGLLVLNNDFKGQEPPDCSFCPYIVCWLTEWGFIVRWQPVVILQTAFLFLLFSIQVLWWFVHRPHRLFGENLWKLLSLDFIVCVCRFLITVFCVCLHGVLQMVRTLPLPALLQNQNF